MTSVAYPTIVAKNLCKRYDNDLHVLQDFSMVVPKGSIYGLLGPSGCGKSTLLNCVIGAYKWDSGKLLVFGCTPGTRGSTRHRKRVGYMPQDLALYDHLSIMETMQYYGRLYDMHKDEFESNWHSINQLLGLPGRMHLVKNLSGGQKRRVSLALALIHKPQLALLDEPTVGLDPVLRCSIWKYLQNLVITSGTTIVITTHYIEEAKLADKIGVMRNGKLLVEDSPTNLLREYKCELLEDVVKNLCYEDKMRNNVISQETYRKVSDPHSLSAHLFQYDSFGEIYSSDSCPKMNVRASCRRVYGFCIVLFLLMLRYPGFSIMTLLVPALQGTLTLLALGSGMQNLNFGIVNYELRNWTTECESPIYETNYSNVCDLSVLSCRYINALRQTNVLNLEHYDSEEEALESVHIGHSIGLLIFPVNYTQDTLDLVAANHYALNSSIEGSRISVKFDYSNAIITFFLTKHLFGSFMSFAQNLASSCNIGAKNIMLPIHFRQPVYGSNDNDFYLTVVPGLIFYSVSIIICFLTCLEFIVDFKRGTMNRARAAGLGTMELIASYIITNSIVALLTILIYTVVLYLLFNINIQNSFVEYMIFCYLCGLFGISMGIWFGVLVRDEVTVVTIGTFIAGVFIILGGVVFPREYQSSVVYAIGSGLPITLPTEGLRSVMTRGFGLSHALVLPGVAADVVWTGFFVVTSAILLPRLCK